MFFTIDSVGRIFLLPSIQTVHGLFALTVNASDGQFSDSVSVLLTLLCGTQTDLYFVLPSQVLARLNEHTAVYTPIRKVTCNSTFSTSQLPISYSLISGNSEGTFDINSTSGIIALARPLLTSKAYSLVVQCSVKANTGNVLIFDTTTVVISVEDDPPFDYQLPLISALGAVVVVFLLTGCIFVIFIAARKITKKKKKRYVTHAIGQHGGSSSTEITTVVVSKIRTFPVLALTEHWTTSEYALLVNRGLANAIIPLVELMSKVPSLFPEMRE